LGLAVQQFDFATGMKIKIAGFSQPQSEERARRLAPEIGFARQQLETLSSKNPSIALSVE
jgi:hypothetical protein